MPHKQVPHPALALAQAWHAFV